MPQAWLDLKWTDIPAIEVRGTCEQVLNDCAPRLARDGTFTLPTLETTMSLLQGVHKRMRNRHTVRNDNPRWRAIKLNQCLSNTRNAEWRRRCKQRGVDPTSDEAKLYLREVFEDITMDSVEHLVGSNPETHKAQVKTRRRQFATDLNQRRAEQRQSLIDQVVDGRYANLRTCLFLPLLLSLTCSY